MRTWPIAITVFAWLLLGAVTALAAEKAVEVVQPRGLLLLGPINQSVGLRYEHFGHDAEKTSSFTDRFKEKYSLSTIAGVWDPELLEINLNLVFWLEQQRVDREPGSSNKSDTSDMEYNLAASAFKYRSYPVVFRSSLEVNHVTNTFSPSYSLETSKNSITAKYFNDVAPVRFHYQHITNDSSGRLRDTSTTNDLMLFTVNNNYRDISLTQFDASWSQQQQEVEQLGSTDSENITFTLNNALYMDNYSLGTLVQHQEMTVESEHQESLDVTETMRAKLGRALTGEAIYRYNHDTLPDFQGRDQEMTSNSLDLSLDHRLFESLHSRLDWQRRDTQRTAGDESHIRAGVSLQYHKKLPAASMLWVNVARSHEETSRDYDVSNLRVTQQALDVNRDEFIDLNVTGGRLVAVERVVDIATGNTIDPVGNYDVDYAFARINIFLLAADFPDPSVAGINVEVTYVVDIDRSPLEYATDVRSLNGTYSLLDGRYRFMSSYYQEDQTLMSGQVAGGRLSDLTELKTRFDARIRAHRFGIECGSHEAGSNRYRYLEEEWYYSRNFPRATLTLQAKDRFTRYEANGANSTSHNENTLTLGSTYARRLYSWVQLLLSIHYANSYSDDLSRDAFYFRTTMQGKLNQILFSVNGTSMLRLNENETTRDDFFSFEITRFF